MQKRFTAGRTKGERMVETMTKKDANQGLPPMPNKDAGPDEWREYHRALFEAGKLTPPGPTK